MSVQRLQQRVMRQILFFSLPILAAAQSLEPRLSIPSLGFVFDDNAKSIRLIAGIPGAAQMDQPVNADASLAGAMIYSRGRVALAALKSGGVAIVDWNGASRVVNLETSLGAVRTAAFSRSGNRVAISDGVNVEVWSDLRGTPTQSLRVSPEGTAKALALNEDGLLGVGTEGGIELLDASSNRRRILSGINVSALTFFANGQDLLAGSGAALHVIRDIRKSSGSSSVIALEKDVTALATSADENWAAAGASDDVVLVNIPESSSLKLGCGCRSDRFDALQGNLVLSATDIRSGGLVVLNLGLSPQVARIPGFGGSAQ